MYKYFFILFIPLLFTFTVSEYTKPSQELKKSKTLTSSNINEIYFEKNIENLAENEIVDSPNIKNFFLENNVFYKYNSLNFVKLGLPKNNINIKSQFIKTSPLVISETYKKIFNIENYFKFEKPLLNYETASLKYISKEISLLNFDNSDLEKNYTKKKYNFIKTILPLITYENHNIILERKKLLSIKNYLDFKKTLIDEDIKYLKNISKKYKIITKNRHKIDIINELLIKVDIIPNSIVLAQAVNESGWGTSRFAKKYNALFGQYTYDEDDGVVPFERDRGKKHLIKNFTSINKSVESYFNNINTHYAYSDFRVFRSKIKDLNVIYNVKELTKYLASYAEDISYVDTINSIIESNNFEQFDLKLLSFTNS